MTLGEQIADIAGATTDQFGDQTTVNGFGPVGAFWDESQPGRIQMYVAESEWDRPAYDVQLPAKVLRAPYSIKDGSYVVWQKHGWRGVVRRVDTPGLNDNDLDITALVVLTAE